MERTFDTRPCQFKGERIFPGFLRLIRPYVRASQRILDVGAGNGHMIRELKTRFPGREFAGIDIEPMGDDVLAMDIRQLEFADGHFDLVICTDVLEHLPDDVLNPGLREVARVSRPGGHQVINTPNDEIFERSLCRCPECGKVFRRVGHIQTFTVAELTERVAAAGLKVEKSRTLHMGGYTLFPRLFSLLKCLRADRFAPPDIRRLLNKDILLICSRPRGAAMG